MSAYVYPNFKTKKAFKEAVQAGEEIIVKENTPYGQNLVIAGEVYVEGPHYPQPHRWYARIIMKDRKIAKIY